MLKKIAPTTKKTFFIMFTLFTIIQASMLYLYVGSKHHRDTFEPRIQLLGFAQLKLTETHLWFEQMLSGDKEQNRAVIEFSFKSVFEILQTLKTGSDKIIPLTRQSQIDLLNKTLTDIDHFIDFAKTRNPTGGEDDKLFDKEFKEIIENLGALKHAIATEAEKNYRTFVIIQISIIFLEIVSFVTATLIMLNFGKRQQNLTDSLQKLNQDLESKVEERTLDLQSKINHIHKTNKILIESEKMAALGTLVAGMAHEINTPIGNSYAASTHFSDIMEHMSQQFKDNSVTVSYFENFITQSKELLTAITSNLERASKLIRSFKLISVDQSCDNSREFYVKAYLDEIMLSMHSATKSKAIKITTECAENIKLTCNPGDIAQIITNLIQNALLHAFKNSTEGELVVRVLREDSHLNILFSDNGQGMGQEIVTHIFEPFFTTNRGNGGSGLGLYIIHNVVTQSLKGTIECKSTVGVGTTFSIMIPLTMEKNNG